jgi:hypothetical protein
MNAASGHPGSTQQTRSAQPAPALTKRILHFLVGKGVQGAPFLRQVNERQVTVSRARSLAQTSRRICGRKPSRTLAAEKEFASLVTPDS